jgi:hypothetical protein
MWRKGTEHGAGNRMRCTVGGGRGKRERGDEDRQRTRVGKGRELGRREEEKVQVAEREQKR